MSTGNGHGRYKLKRYEDAVIVQVLGDDFAELGFKRGDHLLALPTRLEKIKFDASAGHIILAIIGAGGAFGRAVRRTGSVVIELMSSSNVEQRVPLADARLYVAVARLGGLNPKRPSDIGGAGQ